MARRTAWAPSQANASGGSDLDTIEAAWKAQALGLRFAASECVALRHAGCLDQV